MDVEVDEFMASVSAERRQRGGESGINKSRSNKGLMQTEWARASCVYRISGTESIVLVEVSDERGLLWLE